MRTWQLLMFASLTLPHPVYLLNITHIHSPSAARTTQLKKCILWTNATIAFASRFVAHTTHDTPRHNAAAQQPNPKAWVCVQCLGRFVLVKVQEGQTQNMKCPDPDCKEFMTPAEVPTMRRRTTRGGFVCSFWERGNRCDML